MVWPWSSCRTEQHRPGRQLSWNQRAPCLGSLRQFVFDARKSKAEPEDGAKDETKDEDAGAGEVKDEDMPAEDDDGESPTSEEQLLQDACHKFESTLRQPARNLAVRHCVIAFDPATVYGKRAQFLPALIVTAACLEVIAFQTIS